MAINMSEFDPVIDQIERKIHSAVDDVRVKQREIDERLLDIEQRGGLAPANRVTTGAKGIGHLITESDGFKALAAREARTAAVKLPAAAFKNTITNTVAVSPNDPLPMISGAPVQRRFLRDYLPSIPASSAGYSYIRQASWTDNTAAQTAEAAEKAESALTFETVTGSVATIATWLKVSEQLMQDEPAMIAFIESRLRDGLGLAIENQLIAGSGASGQLLGMATTNGHTDFTPTASETALDSLRRAKEALEVATFNPSLVILHPTDIGAIERLKDAQDAYLVGDALRGGLPSVWGLPIHVSTKITAGQMLVLDTSAVLVHERQEVVVEMSRSDDDNFTKNLVTLRCEARLGFSVMQPTGVRYGALVSA